MNSKRWTALGLALGLMAGTAIILVQVGGDQRLGQPGLKLVAVPTFDTNGVMIRNQSVSLPEGVLDYTSEPVGITPLEVNWLPKDTLFGRKQYVGKDGFTVLTSVVLMGTDRTSIHKPQFCLDAQGWRIEKTETDVIPMARPHPYGLRVMKLTASGQTRDKNGQMMKVKGLYVYWFVADNLLTPYHGERMWWMAKEMIRSGVLQRWAYVTYFAGCHPGQEDAAYARLKSLITASVPEFQLTAGPRPSVGSTAGLSETGGPHKN